MNDGTRSHCLVGRVSLAPSAIRGKIIFQQGRMRQAIGFLNHLFRWPVPAELRRSKLEYLQKGKEAVLDLGEGFIQRKLFAYLRFALEPQILDRLLFWSIGSKAQAGDFPGGLGQVDMLLCEKLLHFLPAMIAGPIPEQA